MVLPVNIIQTNFTAGEFSPRLLGRVDIAKYYNSTQLMQNMLPYVHGAVTRRTGTYHVSEVKDSSAATRIIPFKFSTTQNYIIELGNLYMRVYRSRGQVVESSKTITGITQANPGVVTSAAHAYSNGDQFYISGVVGMTQVNGLRYTAANVAANTLELSGVSTAAYTAYSSGGIMERIYTVATPWPSSVLFDLKFTQSADVLYVTHPSYQARKITRTSDTAWTVSTLSNLDGPYLSVNTSATTLTPSGTTGAITITASAATFAATDVNRVVRINHGGTWGWATITGYTSTTQVNATVGGTFGATTAQTSWRLGAWSDTTGWPSCVAFFQERLYFAGNTNQPQTIWGSVVSDYENFAPSNSSGTVSDSSAVTFTIADDQVNAIRWLSAGRVMSIGTSEAEFSLFGGSSGGTSPVTPTNITVQRESTHGSISNVRPRRIGNAVIFVQASGRRVRELTYNFRVDGYESADVTLLAEHITLSGIKDFDYQEEIDSVGWMVRNDGVLIGFTYDRLQDVVAWQRNILGGTGAQVESVAVIPNPSGTGDDLWLVVKRTIGGTTKRYIEYMTDPFDPDTNGQDSAFFVDSGLTYDGYLDTTLTPGATTGSGVTFTAGSSVFTSSMVGRKIKATNGGRATITGYTSGTQVVCSITTAFPDTSAIASGAWSVAIQDISGLYHLNGETVSILADGATHPDKVVSSYGVSLDGFYSKVHIGYSYVSRIKTMPPEVSQRGTVQGQTKRIHRAYINCYKSGAFKYGKSFTGMTPLPARSAGDETDTAPPLIDRIVPLDWPSGYEDSPVVCIEQSLPLPLTILYIVKEMVVYG